MARLTASRRTELESFWRAHLEGWQRIDLNQREYFALHGLPLKRFGNLRAKLKHEAPATAGKLLWRRGGPLRHMSEHRRKEVLSVASSSIPSLQSLGRRTFNQADKRRLVEETCREGASVSGLARKYGIDTWNENADSEEIAARDDDIGWQPALVLDECPRAAKRRAARDGRHPAFFLTRCIAG